MWRILSVGDARVSWRKDTDGRWWQGDVSGDWNKVPGSVKDQFHAEYCRTVSDDPCTCTRPWRSTGAGEGNTNADGSMFYVEDHDGGPGSFRACLDVDLARTFTGAEGFATLEVAADGGMDVPHSEKKFPGFDNESKELNADVHREHIHGIHVTNDDESEDLNTDVHREHIFGIHVANYMTSLQEEDEEAYKKHLSR